MPTRHRSEIDELTHALAGRVRDIARGASERIDQSQHAAELARRVYGQRDELADALETLHRVESGGHHDLLLREMSLAYMEAATRLGAAPHRSELLSEWADLLLVATAEVRRILDSAEQFLTAATHQDDNDRAYREAVRQKTADRWRAA